MLATRECQPAEGCDIVVGYLLSDHDCRAADPAYQSGLRRRCAASCRDFLPNMQLGYLTPPVGLDLFFASSRFGALLREVFRYTVSFFLAMGIVLLLVTSVLWLVLALV